MRLRSRLQYKLDRLLERFGYLRCLDGWNTPFDISEDDRLTIHAVDGFTMTSLERRYHLLHSVRHVVKHRVPGAIVECGVWRGGSMMLVAKALIDCGDTSRDLYLYDTFEGMPPPMKADRDFSGRSAEERLRAGETAKAESGVWAIACLEEVKRNLASVGYPNEKLHFVSGKVESTIPACITEQIAILRLDTDWYESTAHELAHLYPRLVSGGVLIIDDYGYWQGARKAADEFLAATPDKIFLHRIDNSGRAFVKP
jgi:O-methyltransferase